MVHYLDKYLILGEDAGFIEILEIKTNTILRSVLCPSCREINNMQLADPNEFVLAC